MAGLAIAAGFGGIADATEEGERLASTLGNHGVSASAATVAEAFETLYFLEKAAQTMMLAYARGQPLNILSPEVAEKTAEGWKAYRGMAFEHFEYLKRQLDLTDPSWRD